MSSPWRPLYLAGLALLGVLLACSSYADTVRCEPQIVDGRVVGYCFTVCNTLEDPCTEAGCIYDLHLSIVTQGCKFTKVKTLPAGWGAAIATDALGYGAVTPPPGGGDPKPIRPGQCKKFCVRVQCSTDECFVVNWWTTDQLGQVLDQGTARCCPNPTVP
jgi:hypothetical protein